MRYLTKKNILLSLASLAFASAMAIPPMPGMIRVAQPDGSMIEARIVGNADFHYYETSDGVCLVADPADGWLKPARIDESGCLVASDTKYIRGVSRTNFNSAQLTEASMRSRARVADAAAARKMKRVAPGAIKTDFPTTGTVRGLIVLAEFEDVKFQEGSTLEYFDKKVNEYGYSGPETYGSVVDYFKEQSGGKFTPEFEIAGPVTLPRKRADYGLNEDIDGFFREAAKAVVEQTDTDLTRFDINNDSFIDFFFVVFAGHGEAQGGPAEAIWPVMKNESDWVLDAFNGMYLGVCACGCELKHGEGTDVDGIGTICHEFSHIIGLPDIYDPTGSGGYGMGHYDMMDRGPYNNDLITPSGYTAMDRYTVGWLEPRVLEEPEKDVTLRSFASTSDCCFIVNPDNPNEYYTLENRQQEGFDSALPGHGLVISYVNYNKSIWKKNVVNSPGMSRYEHVTIVPADGEKELQLTEDRFVETNDVFPGTARKYTEFNADTTPAAVWKASGTVVPAKFSITNIREHEDGTVQFDFNMGSGVEDILTEAGDARYFNLQGMEVNGESLTPGIYIVRDCEGNASKRVIR